MQQSKQRTKQRGQSMTEYIIIVALIAVGAIAVFQLFGNTVREQTAGMAQELSGQSGAGNISNAQSAANNASTQANTNRGLANYGGVSEAGAPAK